jgi:4-hydroxymandelate synthase
MVAQDVEYVELYTSDKESVANYFVSLLGFTQVAKSVDPMRDSALLRQGMMQLLVTAGPATEKFLDAHGDGIADIAFSCDDVAATLAMALAAGAQTVAWSGDRPVLAGFGSVRHTLLPRTSAPGTRLPPGRDWTMLSSPQPRGRIRLLDHIAVCLAGGTLAEYADFCTAAFGLARYSSDYLEIGDQAMDSIVVRSPSGGITFTFLEPDTSKSPGQIDAFLGRNGGPGVQHLAFLVEDVVSAVREYQSRGVEFLRTPGTYYDMLAERLPDLAEEIKDLRATDVLADRDEWGDLLQLFTRSPYERNTLFYELIQRRGARGFGGENIRALYEAVERDRLAAG